MLGSFQILLTSSLHAVLTDCMSLGLNQHIQLRETSCKILTPMRGKQLHPVVYVDTPKGVPKVLKALWSAVGKGNIPWSLKLKEMYVYSASKSTSELY